MSIRKRHVPHVDFCLNAVCSTKGLWLCVSERQNMSIKNSKSNMKSKFTLFTFLKYVTGFTVHNWSLNVIIKKVLNHLKKWTTKNIAHLFSIQYNHYAIKSNLVISRLIFCFEMSYYTSLMHWKMEFYVVRLCYWPGKKIIPPPNSWHLISQCCWIGIFRPVTQWASSIKTQTEPICQS